MRGTVKWYSQSKAYGFIAQSGDGRDLFVQQSEVRKAGYATLAEGTRVSFDVGQFAGKPCAVDLVVRWD